VANRRGLPEVREHTDFELSARHLGHYLGIASGNLLDLLIGVGDTPIALTQFAKQPVVGADGATALIAAVDDAM
jgi:hypothetical protein